MIENPGENQERWRNTPVSERIDIFMKWLGAACNKDSLFIVDDIEAFGYTKIPTILGYPAHHALVSTRDSNLIWTGRYFREFRLPPLGYIDTVKILERTLESLSRDSTYRNDLDLVAHRVQGHPLAARNAMPFIMQYLPTYDSPNAAFADLFASDDPEERKLFLKFNFEDRSLWAAFNTSLERLEFQKDHLSAASLLQILPFLCFHNDSVDDFFKMDKRCLRESKEELSDIVVLQSGFAVISSELFKLRGVSFYLYNDTSSRTKALNIHPLMSQYMLLHIDEQRRISLMRQVLQLFYNLVAIAAEREVQIKPHVQHCIRVCRGLGVSPNDLDLADRVMKWVSGLLEEGEEAQELGDSDEGGENPFDDPVELLQESVDEFVTLCFGMREKLHGYGNLMSEGSAAYKMIVDCNTAYKEVRRHLGAHESVPESCKPDLAEAITVFQDMVRSLSIYPEFILELEDFRGRLQQDQ
ncbi:hypothetical protein FGADI_11112 [Fusarium gaditjirri]|uniref:Uncharacterized protein n=1 Tax=Fusarium gaditjirri TaxID=282569 RepID=A0A8H4WQV4_9HYPO|nr:hypothetical protein FGADI_11112 [Fusarium gaditjirri]